MDEKRIGLVMREIRQRKGYTLSQIAQKADLAVGTLSKIERAEISPPISTLIRIAEALESTLPHIIVQASPQTANFVVTKAGEGVRIEHPEHNAIHEALDVPVSFNAVEPFVYTQGPDFPTQKSIVEASVSRDRFSQHDGWEFTYMLSGKLVVTISDETIVLCKGDSLFLSASDSHRYLAIGKKPAKFLRLHIKMPR